MYVLVGLVAMAVGGAAVWFVLKQNTANVSVSNTATQTPPMVQQNAPVQKVVSPTTLSVVAAAQPSKPVAAQPTTNGSNTPIVTILAPRGDESISANGMYTIRWSSANIPKDARLDIRLLFPNGNSLKVANLWTAAFDATTSPEAAAYIQQMTGGYTIDGGKFVWKVSDTCAANPTDGAYCAPGATGYKIDAFIVPNETVNGVCNQFKGTGCAYRVKAETAAFAIVQ